MSEPYWSALGARAGDGGVDYEGAWSAGTAYLAGDVVNYNGVDYLAVNPSTGATPPVATPAGLAYGTSLPTPFFDGQEAILVDSLAAPTYAWRFRYVAAKASNKWVFIGGSPIISEVATSESTASTSYAALTTPGPSVVVPVAGDYMVEHGARLAVPGAFLYGQMSYDIGGTGAVDADMVQVFHPQAGANGTSVSRLKKKSLAAVTLTAKYKVSGSTLQFADRFMALTPIAVGG